MPPSIYGYTQEVAVAVAANTLNIHVDNGGPELTCHAIWLHNNGSEVVHFTYNTSTLPVVTNSFEIAPGVIYELSGTDGEQIKKLIHNVVVGTGSFKWAKLR